MCWFSLKWHLQQPQRLGLDFSTLAGHPRAAYAFERFLKNRSRGRRAIRTLSTTFPNSRSGRHLVRQRESELMREHTYLPAIVGLVRKHVAQHFQASRPGPSPGVSVKFLNAARTTAEGLREHLRAASGALR